LWAVASSSNSGPEITTSAITGGGLGAGAATAFDGGNNLWVTNAALNSVSEFTVSDNTSSGTATATAVSPSTGYTAGGTLGSPYGIAVDGSGNVWVASNYVASITELVGAATPVATPLSAAIASGLTANRP